MRTVASHSGTAMPRLRDSCVVGVKVYGRRPRILRVIRKTIREVRIRAHLCPFIFKGMRICWVNRLMNQPWRVSRRLLSHRVDGEG